MTKELRNKLFSQFVLAISQAIFPLVTYPVITTALGPAGMGKVVYIDSWVQILGLFAGLGIPLYGIREIAKKKDDAAAQSQTFFELFFLQAIAVVPLVFVLFFVGIGYGFKGPFLILAITSFIGNAFGSEWFLQGREEFRYIMLRTVFIRVLTLVLIVLFIKKRNDVLLYYFILVAGAMLTTFLNLFLALRNAVFSFKSLYLFQHLKKMNWLFGCYLLFSFYSLTDSIILGALSNEAAVGTYNLGYRLIRLSGMFILSLGTVFIPKISYLHAAGNRSVMSDDVRTSQQILFFFALPFSIFLFNDGAGDCFRTCHAAFQRCHHCYAYRKFCAPVSWASTFWRGANYVANAQGKNAVLYPVCLLHPQLNLALCTCALVAGKRFGYCKYSH